MPFAAASSGWIITVGRFSRAREVGVSLKVELRKLRAGEVASRNGNSAVASSITSQWSGSTGLVDRSRVPRRAERHGLPVRLEAELAVGPGEALGVVRG